MTGLKWMSGLVAAVLVLVVMGSDLAAVLDQYGPDEKLAADHPRFGRQMFKKCAICHSLVPGEHKVGPSLYCVVNRPKAAFSDYRYSRGMRRQGLDDGAGVPLWTREHLTAYIMDPALTVEGGRMPFPGLGAAAGEAVGALIDHLEAQCDEQAFQLVKITTSLEREPQSCTAIISTATLQQCSAALRTLDETDVTDPQSRSFISCVPKDSLACR